jgi:hypothetical protein
LKLRYCVWLACLLLPACRISVPEGVLQCQTAQDCPVDWVCERARCVRTPSAQQVRSDVVRPVRDAAVSVVSESNIGPDARVPMVDEDAGPPPCEADGCGCEDGETKPCYTGPAGTSARGRCAAGVATCRHGRFGACQDERLPGEERCTNLGVDDDCDGQLDEGLELGALCEAPGAQGACALGVITCQASAAAPACLPAAPVAEGCNGLDDDCDGQTDEAFVLASDAQNCGSCGAACASGEVCCGGQCQSTLPDGFGNECGGLCDTAGTIQCDGSCSRADPTDLDDACGRCGGRIQCDGSCSVPEPPDYGVRCRDGISTVGCSGSCECERQCPSGQIIPCTSLCPILCVGNICIEL